MISLVDRKSEHGAFYELQSVEGMRVEFPATTRGESVLSALSSVENSGVSVLRSAVEP
jgi:hypothetical protein